MSSKIKNKTSGDDFSHENDSRVAEGERKALEARMFKAKLRLAEGLSYDPTLEELAERFAANGGGATPAASVVGGWLRGKPPRGLHAQKVFARVLGVDPGWLYFGSESLAPAPGPDGVREAIRRLRDYLLEITGGNPVREELPYDEIRPVDKEG